MMKMVLWLCLVTVTMATNTLGYSDDTYNEIIKMDVSDSANAIARFLGFKCPKGYRCLPVLECLPCDYGSYKSNEGSDLCEHCPSGCTTLRKGAENWKECVPKCPPGYEESECGKTCTKCRAGYYKSNWKNVKCSKCPSRAIYDRNTVGMTKRRQCFDAEDTTDEPTPVVTEQPVTGGCEALGSCNADEYSEVRLEPAPGSNCSQFCQCAYQAGSTGEEQTHYWVLQDCALGTMFDDLLKVCVHENAVLCIDQSTSSPPASVVVTEDAEDTTDEPTPVVTEQPVTGGCEALGSCDADEYSEVRLEPAPGSNCSQFCQCAYQAGSTGEEQTHYWVLHDCALGTMFDDSLKVCVHESTVLCIDQSISSPPTSDVVTEVVTESPVTGGCEALGSCVADEYSEVRLEQAPGSNCSQFCQCAYQAGSTGEEQTHYWVLHDCALGTRFDDSFKVCVHESTVLCIDQSISSPPASDVVTEVVTESPVTGGCEALGSCDADEYSEVRLEPAPGSNCSQFCQCAYQAGSTGEEQTHYWVLHDCALGTRFDDSLKVCVHESTVLCIDQSTSSPPASVVVTEAMPSPNPSDAIESTVGDQLCEALGPCDEVQYAIERLVPAPGSNCTQFCQCAFRDVSTEGEPTYYWQLLDCGVGTLFDGELKVCNHEDTVDCIGTMSTTPLPGQITTGGTSSMGCSAIGTCDMEQYNDVRLLTSPGSSCTQFCQCAFSVGSSGLQQTYYWVLHDCPVGTLFNETLKICDHQDYVQCGATTTYAYFP